MKILRNILFFLLLFLVGFFMGILVADLVDAGKGQMLAGGAIVLGYGVVGAGFGLVIAIASTTFLNVKPTLIVLSNKILAIILLGLFIFFYIRFEQRQAEKIQNEKIGVLLDAFHSSH